MFSRENFYRPEDHMDGWKIKRLKRVLQTYLMDKNIHEDVEWQFDLACVYLVGDEVKKVEWVLDIIL